MLTCGGLLFFAARNPAIRQFVETMAGSQSAPGTEQLRDAGAPGRFEVFLSDYRDVGDRRFPHKRVTLIDGNEFATTTLESIEVDPELDPTLFEKPAA